MKTIYRLPFIIFFFLLLFTKEPTLWLYVSVFFVLVEYLNRLDSYKHLPYKTSYNIFFVFFVAFILWVRSDVPHFEYDIRYQLNSLEHLLFSWVICLLGIVFFKIRKIYTQYPFGQIVLVWILFNTIGWANEYFQNISQQQPDYYLLKSNNLKDIRVNLLGSSIFVVFYLLRNRYVSVKQS